MKKAVGGKTRVDLAVDQIIQVILDRDMKAGDKLPNEYDLARRIQPDIKRWAIVLRSLVWTLSCGGSPIF